MSVTKSLYCLALVFVFVLVAVLTFYCSSAAVEGGGCCDIYWQGQLVGRGDYHWQEPCVSVQGAGDFVSVDTNDPEEGCWVCDCYRGPNCTPGCVYYCLN